MPHSEFNESLDELIGRAAEEYAERIARGDQVDIDEFVAGFPNAAQQLRRILPMVAIARMESSDSLNTPVSHTLGFDHADSQLGDFRLIRPIGQGGMGIVHEAEQLSMGRRVALKILPYASLLSPHGIARFRNEVRAAALLDHPNIVSVYAVGEERGVHYFAMQLVRGRSLADVIESLHNTNSTNRTTTQPTEAGIQETTDAISSTLADSSDALYFRHIAEMGIQVAAALQHAHDRGVVHRDIKPANLLIDSAGTLFVTDFGLAHMDNQATITAEGDLVGTLRYMSPEQASGESRFVDFRTDIYSLGITLYELTTLRPAFAGTSRPQLISQISSGEFPPPRSVRSSVPRDLETIILKATAQVPQDRYSSAQECANDLRAFIEHRPVRASRPGIRDKTKKWMSRHPGTLASAIAMSLVLASVLGIALLIIERSKEKLEVANGQARSRTVEALIERDAKESLLYAADLKLASEALREARAGSARERLQRHIPQAGDADRRNFAWQFVWGELNPETQIVSFDEPLRDARFSPRNNLVAVARDSGKITIWQRDSETVLHTLVGHDDVVNQIAFSPEGETLASASDDGTIGLWSVTSGTLLHRITAHPDGVVCLCWGADNILYSAGDREVKCWQAPWLSPIATLGPHPGTIGDISLSQEQRLLAVASANTNSEYAGIISLWDLPAGTLRSTWPHRHKCTSVEFHPQDNRFAVGTQMGDLLLWHLDNTDEPIATLRGHTSLVYDVAFSTDGTLISSASKDMTVRLWDTDSGALHRAYLSHTRRALSVAFAPDEPTLLSASADGTCRFWSTNSSGYREQSVPYGVGNHNCAYNHAEKYFVLPTFGQSGVYDQYSNRFTPIPISIWQNYATSPNNHQLVILGGSEYLYQSRESATHRLAHGSRSKLDLDGDSDRDEYAVFGPSSLVVWQELDRTGQHLPPKLWQSAVRSPTTVLADHNNDGRNDLIYIDRWKRTIELNRDRRPYMVDNAELLVQDLPAASLVLISDFDLDRKPDVVSIDPTSGSMAGYFQLNTEAGRFDPVRNNIGAGGTLATNSIATDFDQDGDNDIIMLAASTKTIVCFANDGHGTFQIVQEIIAPSNVLALDTSTDEATGNVNLLAAGPECILQFAAHESGFAETATVLQNLPELTPPRAIPSNVAIYDVSSQRLIGHFYAHNRPQSVAISPTGNEIVTASADRQLCFWNTNGRLVSSIPKNTTQVTRMCYSANGDRLCVANGDQLHIYDARKHQLLHECRGHESTIVDLILLNGTQLVATASEDLTIRLWSLETGRAVSTMIGHTTSPTALTLAADERLLASGDVTGVVKLWDVETGSELLELTDFRYHVRGLAFTTPNVLTVIGSDFAASHTGPTFLGEWTVRPESRVVNVVK